MNVDKYLKSIGLLGQVKHAQLDKRLLLSLNDNERTNLYIAWEKMRSDGPVDLYSIPKTLRQASLLFSVDYYRIKASIEWISKQLKFLDTKSVVDVGCGYGILISFLQKKFPNLNFMGVDKQENLIKIGSSLTGVELICADYSKFESKYKYDTIICDFGFDLSDLQLPDTPHSSSEIEGIVYCPGCYKDFKEKLHPFMVGWRKWGGLQPDLIMTGRMTANNSYLLATLKVASDLNWRLNMSKTSCLKVRDPRTKESEKFPGFVFHSYRKHSDKKNKVEDDFVQVMKILNS